MQDFKRVTRKSYAGNVGTRKEGKKKEKGGFMKAKKYARFQEIDFNPIVEVVNLLVKNKRKGASFKEIYDKIHVDKRLDRKKIVRLLDMFCSELREKNYYIKDKKGKKIKVNRWVRYWYI